jgi:hypothetical protein
MQTSEQQRQARAHGGELTQATPRKKGLLKRISPQSRWYWVRQLLENPLGSTTLGIDDYREGFSQATGEANALTLPKQAVAKLLRLYGLSGRLVRVG